VRTRVVAMGVVLCGIGVIFLTGSRSAMLGTFVAIVVALYLLRKSFGKKEIVVSCIVVLIAVVICFLYWSVVWGYISSFLALDSKYRGLTSGATGREIAWAAAWEIFKENPWLGVGYRAHRDVLKIASSAHNGYLATLVEVGILGFSSAMVIIFSGLIGLRRRAAAGERSSALLLALIFGYLVIAMFERFLFNQGNPTSLIFMLGVFWGAQRSVTASGSGN